MGGLRCEQVARIRIDTFEAVPQMDCGRPVEFAQNFVVRRFGYSRVEVHVGVYALFQPARFGRLFPFGQVGLHSEGILLCIPFSGLFDDGRFEDSPYFVQLPDVGPFQALRHEVRCVPAYDECPGSLTYPEEPHVGEYPDGFAYRGTADSEDAHQFRFGGKFLSDAESACGNLFLESCRQLFSQRFFPYGRILHHHII